MSCFGEEGGRRIGPAVSRGRGLRGLPHPSLWLGLGSSIQNFSSSTLPSTRGRERQGNHGPTNTIFTPMLNAPPSSEQSAEQTGVFTHRWLSLLQTFWGVVKAGTTQVIFFHFSKFSDLSYLLPSPLLSFCLCG